MLKRLEIAGFKSFAKKTVLDFASRTTAIVGPNGSGKSNVAEAFRFALGEQSMKSMRGKRAEDLIWNGSHGTPRASRAAVAVVFDNSKKQFKIDFDEVVIERVAYRDGSSEYFLNGTKVRLRDIDELLAGAGIGETSHHIISQGETDRILLANPRERRQMLEDALGLAVYEFKKEEAEKKLLKTEENIREVNALRRELAPHLQFLERQVEKLERADQMRGELVRSCQTYFAIEDVYLVSEKRRSDAERIATTKRVAELTAELTKIEEGATTDAEGAKRLDEVRKLEREPGRLGGERATLSRELGRVEGALAAAKRRSAEVAREPYAKVPREDLEILWREVERQAEGDKAPDAIAAALRSIVATVRAFMERFASPADDVLAEEEKAAYTLEREKTELTAKETKLEKEHENAKSALARGRSALVAHDEEGRELRRRIVTFAENKAKAEGEATRLEARLRELIFLAGELDAAKAEAVALAGTAAVSYTPLVTPPKEERKVQEERKKGLERLKIRLEEAGGAGEEIRTEHKEVSEREAFLTRELDDLDKSAAGLRSLIGDLDSELAKHFADGLAKVNAAFGEFFGLLFGGGGARLIVELSDAETLRGGELDDDEALREEKPGIEIAVTIPKKRVQSLMQLSGGERALTSIALIFAMSQVNPPPFLILDETDAALDEANSRRYGDIIENLAEKSQLIVITHNRETMSRASVLYGVTMGGDGVSKLLSVKFDEALAVAK